VISALLQIDCFPAGMELFPAADDDSLTLIKSVINDSDYYLVILAGRYGSVHGPSGKSYTHLEYEYAVDSGKPTIALLHSNPGSLAADRTERTEETRKLFEAFSAELKKKNCRYWTDRAELTAAVFTGVQHLKKTRPALGWTQNTTLSDEGLKDELLRVRREMEMQGLELAEAKARNAPTGVDGLEQGSDQTSIVIEFAEHPPSTFTVEWDEIMRSVLPQTLGAGAEDADIRMALASLARESEVFDTLPLYAWDSARLSLNSFGRVINQMVALGLIEGRQHPSASTPETIWVATPYGFKEGSRLVALKRKNPREPWR